MMTKQDRERARELTMGCWWPCKAMGKTTTDWGGIADELLSLSFSELQRGNLDRVREAASLAGAAADMI